MKKILCLGLTVLILVCCLCIAGCEYDDIQYIAERPILKYESELYEYFDEAGNKTESFWTLKHYEPLERLDYFKDFSEYYKDNLKGNKTYLLNRPNEDLRPLPPVDQYGYIYFKNKQSGELVLYENYSYYDRELGGNDCGDKGGCSVSSLSISVYIKPSAKDENKNFTFEFGEIRGDVVYNKYVNIYTGEECFATCYYHKNVNIPKAWFENFFKTNLIYGDDL